jgi:hypothetical protein
MKSLIIASFVVSVSLLAPAFGHDEGHGPKLTDSPKQGGVVSPVIDAKEAKKGAKAAVVHKAELVRAEDGSVKVYFYDQEMNALDLSKFDKDGKGVLEFKKGKKWTKKDFKFKQEEGFYTATPPKAASKPFNIDVRVKAEGKELLAAFDNLD